MNILKEAVKVEEHDDFHIDNGICENPRDSNTVDPMNLPKKSILKCDNLAKTFICEQCDYSTCRSDALIQHTLKYHWSGPSELYFPDGKHPPKAPTKNAESADPRQHLAHFNAPKSDKRKDTEEKPFKCQQCDSAFNNLRRLRLHQGSHSIRVMWHSNMKLK